MLTYGYAPNTIMDLTTATSKPAIANYIYDLAECWKLAATYITEA